MSREKAVFINLENRCTHNRFLEPFGCPARDEPQGNGSENDPGRSKQFAPPGITGAYATTTGHGHVQFLLERKRW